MPTKRPGKITNRVVADKAETTAPSAAPDTQSESLAKPARPEEANAPTGAQAAVQPAASPEAAKQPPNSLLQAMGDLFGARASPTQQPIDPTPTGSTGWAVQLAASKSEDEAKNDLQRLNATYASALNGSIVRLHKARVGGETVYRLRVVGLSKTDAATLCDRLKGDGGSCFIVR
jgi:cell division septation protein DedD